MFKLSSTTFHLPAGALLHPNQLWGSLFLGERETCRVIIIGSFLMFSGC